ncbi:hypothetical protein ACQR16_10150 [Bradyrhizobium oligotrophicum]|uniref:hypothetical protein n=1 Tax=Bradyrhizobium oligotrophicum TaxID=44255 RepID=UPI003EB6E03C
MFLYLQFRRKLRKLERDQRSEEKGYEERIAEAKKRGAKGEEISDIDQEGLSLYFHYQDEIQQLHSSYLISQARRLFIPAPPLNDKAMWDHDIGDRVFLSEQGINQLRAAIRVEKKARAEFVLMWVPGLVGILGTLIGLASILKK